jgi:DNA adenine methylase
VADWRETLAQAHEQDFVYADPPYIGRHTDYYNKWTEKDAIELFERLKSLPCGFALSTWSQNRYRSNPYLPSDESVIIKTFNHFYHVGPTESLRNPMVEALVVRKGFEI